MTDITMSLTDDEIANVARRLAEMSMPSDEKTARAVAKILFDVDQVTRPLREIDVAEAVPAMMGNHLTCASNRIVPKS
jgi:hypothetical protein